MSHNVYTVEFLGSPNHIAIFISTKPNEEEGLKFHVVGTILNGMTYEKKTTENPELDPTFVPDSKVRIGSIETADLDRFESVCEAVSPPGAQVYLNGKRKDPEKPLRRCGEWVQEVRERVVAEGILRI